jgi:hypothetical protein
MHLFTCSADANSVHCGFSKCFILFIFFFLQTQERQIFWACFIGIAAETCNNGFVIPAPQILSSVTSQNPLSKQLETTGVGRVSLRGEFLDICFRILSFESLLHPVLIGGLLAIHCERVEGGTRHQHGEPNDGRAFFPFRPPIKSDERCQ